jgi:hypothetical protein
LNGAFGYSSVSLNTIGALPNLIYLTFYDLYAPTVLDKVFQNGNLLNSVNLSLERNQGFDDAYAFVIAMQCPHIHVLTLAYIQGFTDDGLYIILTNCSSLHYLDIYGMKDITGSSFACIPHYAQRLNFLVIEDFCTSEKEENLNALLRSSSKVRVHRPHEVKISRVDCSSDVSHYDNTNSWYMDSKYDDL